jgi:acyl-ACP thioesterase
VSIGAEAGRRFRHFARVGLGDAAPDGRARLDALARWLQDAAYLDVIDAGFEGRGAWVVRRSRMDVARFPGFGEQLELTTWCSGLGKMWAERRTTIAGDRGGAVETTAVWVFIDPGSGRPRPLEPEQVEVWGPSAGHRRVRARLTHEDPPAGARAEGWRFRRADLDIADHVNNAAYWQAVEEHLELDPAVPVVAEVEHRGAANAGEAVIRGGQDRWWICSTDGETHASIRLTMDV